MKTSEFIRSRIAVQVIFDSLLIKGYQLSEKYKVSLSWKKFNTSWARQQRSMQTSFSLTKLSPTFYNILTLDYENRKSVFATEVISQKLEITMYKQQRVFKIVLQLFLEYGGFQYLDCYLNQGKKPALLPEICVKEMVSP